MTREQFTQNDTIFKTAIIAFIVFGFCYMLTGCGTLDMHRENYYGQTFRQAMPGQVIASSTGTQALLPMGGADTPEMDNTSAVVATETGEELTGTGTQVMLVDGDQYTDKTTTVDAEGAVQEAIKKSVAGQETGEGDNPTEGSVSDDDSPSISIPTP